MTDRYWDIFFQGRWIGMTSGANLVEAHKVTKQSLPAICDQVKYREWFGRLHPDNCKTSGGNVPDPGYRLNVEVE